jgi:hypothetical protein
MGNTIKLWLIGDIGGKSSNLMMTVLSLPLTTKKSSPWQSLETVEEINRTRQIRYCQTTTLDFILILPLLIKIAVLCRDFSINKDRAYMQLSNMIRNFTTCVCSSFFSKVKMSRASSNLAWRANSS